MYISVCCFTSSFRDALLINSGINCFLVTRLQTGKHKKNPPSSISNKDNQFFADRKLSNPLWDTTTFSLNRVWVLFRGRNFQNWNTNTRILLQLRLTMSVYISPLPNKYSLRTHRLHFTLKLAVSASSVFIYIRRQLDRSRCLTLRAIPSVCLSVDVQTDEESHCSVNF